MKVYPLIPAKPWDRAFFPNFAVQLPDSVDPRDIKDVDLTTDGGNVVRFQIIPREMTKEPNFILTLTPYDDEVIGRASDDTG